MSPQAILAASDAPVRALRHRMLLGRPIVEVEAASGAVRLHDARTGARLPPVDARQAAAVALGAFATDIVGRTSTTDPVTLVVDRNMKVGHFTLSFT